MSVVTYWTDSKEAINEMRVLCKGAPEYIKPLLKSIPNDYDK